MHNIALGFFLGAIITLGLVAFTDRSSDSNCSQAAFYMEPQHGSFSRGFYRYPSSKQPELQIYKREQEIDRKGPRRILEESLIGGPWENQ